MVRVAVWGVVGRGGVAVGGASKFLIIAKMSAQGNMHLNVQD